MFVAETTAIESRLLHFLVWLFCAPHNYKHKGIVHNLCDAVFLCVPVIQTLISYMGVVNPLNAELNPICHLLALLGAHHIFHVSRIRVKSHLSSAGIIRISPYSHR